LRKNGSKIKSVVNLFNKENWGTGCSCSSILVEFCDVI
jgi:hypothetical protein